MKVKVLFMMCIFSSALIIAQTGINYKAVITDDSGNLVINTPVHDEDFDGLLINSESHSTVTDDSGKVILTVGTGTVISGTFDGIFSGPNETALNVQVDIGGGLMDMGTTAFTSVPYAFHSETASIAQNLTGLELIIEGGAPGWRLIGAQPSFYGDIGFQAVDLSIHNSTSNARGATGQYAFASGFGTVASGTNSSAFGLSNVAAGPYTAVFGNANQATSDASLVTGQSNDALGSYTLISGRENRVVGTYSAATGFQNIVNGDYSLATGFSIFMTGNGAFASGNNTRALGNNTVVGGSNSLASGNNSITVGFETTSDGNRSAAFGSNTFASSFSSFVLGRYNVAGGDASNWIGMDPLFEIGIGTGTSDRENAITVLKNGNVGIGTAAPVDPLHVDGIFRIGTETIEDTGSNQLSIGASLIPNTNNAYRLGNSSSRWIGVWAVDGTINTSDRRDKKNIVELPYGLQEIEKLKPVSFNWKNRPEAGTKLGLIAQDLHEVIPEVVMTEEVVYSEEDGTKFQKKPLDRLGVYYSDLIPVLIKAIQEQQVTITHQNNKNLQQENELIELKKKYESLLLRIISLETKTTK